MSVDRKQANLQKLKEADEIQDKTKEAVLRIHRQAAATEEIAITSLDELRKQGQQMVCLYIYITFCLCIIFLHNNKIINSKYIHCCIYCFRTKSIEI